VFMFDQSLAASRFIAERVGDWRPQLALQLGSGLGDVVSEMSNPISIPYQEIPGFVSGNVQGHAQALVLGELAGVKVACLQGRAHFYEGVSSDVLCTMVRSLQRLGCGYWFGTCAVGSLQAQWLPGQLVALNDHINFQGSNPLLGPNDDTVGPRFVAMDDAYDAELRKRLQVAAKGMGMDLPEGVYIGVLGPSYETAAEIRAFKAWGADVVGMSTVAEVILARHCGMRVAVVATVTNLATGLSGTAANHGEVLEAAAQAAVKLRELLNHFLESIK
jgi:xanthosine phosphorylase